MSAGRKPVFNETHQRCYVCKEWKPLDGFHKSSQRLSGRRLDCKECKKKIAQIEKIKYAAQKKTAGAEWRANNRQRHRDMRRAWREKNPERQKFLEQRWEKANPDKRYLSRFNWVCRKEYESS
jgi:hypothetical protein